MYNLIITERRIFNQRHYRGKAPQGLYGIN